MAKELHPGKKNNLNALCDRYGVDNSQRTLHGALLDAEILAEVYLAMTRGQESLLMDLGRRARQMRIDSCHQSTLPSTSAAPSATSPARQPGRNSPSTSRCWPPSSRQAKESASGCKAKAAADSLPGR
jgi:DNA polymerase III epsilon subunit-like protein